MEKDHSIGLIILVGIVAIGLTGGIHGAGNNGLFSSGATPVEKQNSIANQIQETELKVKDLQKKVQEEEDKKTQSKYKGIVRMYYINRSTDPAQEYVTLHVDNTNGETIPVTGWTLKSTSSGRSVNIPKATYLYFAGSINTEDPIYLTGGDTLYLVTGISPNGASFKSNKCSGYLSQFQTFVPYLSSSCPRPGEEDLSSIPTTVNNDACLDYIQYFPSCRIQTDPTPANWSYECTNFIYKKINYPACVDAHKNNKNFYQPEWRVYLKRNEPLWKNSRENVVLYDNEGKIVDTLSY